MAASSPKRLGKIPAEGEVFEIEGLQFTVFKADERRVESFLVEERSVFDEVEEDAAEAEPSAETPESVESQEKS